MSWIVSAALVLIAIVLMSGNKPRYP